MSRNNEAAQAEGAGVVLSLMFGNIFALGLGFLAGAVSHPWVPDVPGEVFGVRVLLSFATTLLSIPFTCTGFYLAYRQLARRLRP